MPRNSRFTDRDIDQMRALKKYRVPLAHIAKHFETTTPTIKYYTDMIDPHSVNMLLDIFTFDTKEVPPWTDEREIYPSVEEMKELEMI